MSQDFRKGKIYKIINDYNDDVYIGSTCDILTKRFSCHKSSINRKCHLPFYKLILEIGFDRFRIELIEDYPCEDIYQLRQREGFYIRQLGTLNKLVAGRTRKEYNEEHKEQRKEHYENNKDIILEKQKEYRENNREVILEKQKEYYLENKDYFRKKKRILFRK